MAEKISQINVGSTVYDIVDQEHRNRGGGDVYHTTNLSQGQGPGNSSQSAESGDKPLTYFKMALSPTYTLVYYTLVYDYRGLGDSKDFTSIPGIDGYNFNLVVKPNSAKTAKTEEIFFTMANERDGGLYWPKNNFIFCSAADNPLVVCETSYLNNSTRTNAAASFATYPYGLTISYKEAVPANTQLKFYTQGTSPRL